MSYGGLADIAYGAVNNDGFVYTPAEKRDLDIAKANEILDAAGYKAVSYTHLTLPTILRV